MYCWPSVRSRTTDGLTGAGVALTVILGRPILWNGTHWLRIKRNPIDCGYHLLIFCLFLTAVDHIPESIRFPLFILYSIPKSLIPDFWLFGLHDHHSLLSKMNTNSSILEPTGHSLQDTLSRIPVSTMLNAFIVMVIIYGLYRISQIGKRDKRMPPGPPTVPILGNLHQIPITGLYKKSVPPHHGFNGYLTVDALQIQRMGWSIWRNLLSKACQFQLHCSIWTERGARSYWQKRSFICRAATELCHGFSHPRRQHGFHRSHWVPESKAEDGYTSLFCKPYQFAWPI